MSKTVTTLSALPPEVRGDIEQAVRILSALPSVRRVWLFGSAAKGKRPDFRSDLDLAVEGLPADRYLEVLGDLDTRLGIPPDVVRWEDAAPALRREIEGWGIVVYERA